MRLPHRAVLHASVPAVSPSTSTSSTQLAHAIRAATDWHVIPRPLAAQLRTAGVLARPAKPSATVPVPQPCWPETLPGSTRQSPRTAPIRAARIDTSRCSPTNQELWLFEKELSMIDLVGKLKKVGPKPDIAPALTPEEIQRNIACQERVFISSDTPPGVPRASQSTPGCGG
jgi:hypothetical protein